jgi:hypothetical protein
MALNICIFFSTKNCFLPAVYLQILGIGVSALCIHSIAVALIYGWGAVFDTKIGIANLQCCNGSVFGCISNPT